MKRLLAITAVFAATVMIGSSAQAAGFGVSWGNGYNNYNSNYRGYGNYGRSYSNYGHYGSRYNNHRSNYRGSYHDTSHYDYHPPSLQRHGNHYDYTPGHYDFHRSGHHH